MPITDPARVVGTTNGQYVGEPVDVRVLLHWRASGQVTQDGAGKLVLTPLRDGPGLYRMTLLAGVTGARPRVYIGETDNLRRRLAVNHRSPGPSQQTNLRINTLLREHLGTGGSVDLAVATDATVWLSGVERSLDLTRRAGRLLAESAALVLAQTSDTADIVNLG